MHIKSIILNLASQTAPEYLVPVLLALLTTSVIFALLLVFKPRWRHIVYAVLIVVLMRIVLFDQFISWGFYKDHVSVEDVGWRPQSGIYIEYYKFFKQKPVRYLAVGSSQTTAIYKEYSKDHNDLTVFGLAGMAPLDFYLYRHDIAARKPQTILLYLSEFDLAKEPRLDAAKDAPAQGLIFLELFPVLYDIARKAHSEISLKEMVAGQLLPEYRYAFLFKGLRDQWMKKNQALQTPSLYDQLKPDALQLQLHATSVIGDMEERWIPYNRLFLMKFLTYCRAQGFKVIIVEGHYNPVAFNEKSLRLHEQVHQLLEEVVRSFDNVRFVPRSAIAQFTQDDYSDVMHVKPDAGYRFVTNLMKYLQTP
jgi:hypothetical protein